MSGQSSPIPPGAAWWLPRADEYDLARSLGLVSPESLAEWEEAINQAQRQRQDRQPGGRTAVRRWPVHRVVQAMARLGVCNTPQGRSATYAWLANHAGEIAKEQP